MSCKYRNIQWADEVYIYLKDADVEVSIDNGRARCTIDGDVADVIPTGGIEVSESDSLDERYAFERTLTFTAPSYPDEYLLGDEVYIVLKTRDGEFYLFNYQESPNVSYDYTFAEEGESTTFTITDRSNYPLMLAEGVDVTYAKPCEYAYDKPLRLFINPKAYSSYNNGVVRYTNSGFSEIDVDSLSLSESFDGTNVTQNVALSISIEAAYLLQEFQHNTYSVVVQTALGRMYCLGFDGGLQATYEVSDAPVANVTLSQISGEENGHIEITDELSPITSTEWVYTSDHDGYECVSDGTAKYLLQMEVDKLGNQSGKYKALQGYESYFPDLDIVGTFTDVVTFQHSSCVIPSCTISTTLPSNLTLVGGSRQVYSVTSNERWAMTLSGVTVTPSTGNSGTTRVIVSAATTPTTQTGYIELDGCYRTIRTNVTIISQASQCLPDGTSFTVNANKQQLKMRHTCPINRVELASSRLGIASFDDDYIYVDVYANGYPEDRTATLYVFFEDGGQAAVGITQTAAVWQWIVTNQTCSGGNLYDLQTLYTGATAATLKKTNQTQLGDLLEENVPECLDELIRYDWQMTGRDYCSNGNICYVQAEMVSYDGGETWQATGYERLSSPTHQSCSEGVYEYSWELTEITGCASPVSSLPKLVERLDNGNTITIEYDGNPTLTQSDTTMLLPNGNTRLVTAATVGNDITQIEANAFSGFSFMYSVQLPNSLTQIGINTFENTFQLSNIDIPECLYNIPGGAFLESGLIYSKIPEGATSIGTEAFKNCEKLKYVDIGANVSTIAPHVWMIDTGRTSQRLELCFFPQTPPQLSGQSGTLNANFLSGRNSGNTVIYVSRSSYEEYHKTLNNPYYRYRGMMQQMDWLCTVDSTSNTRQHISSTGGSQSYITSGLVENYKATAKKVRIDLDCQEIQEASFSGWPIVELEFRENVNYIRNYAFKDCIQLTKIVITQMNPWLEVGVDAFANCPIQELWLPFGASGQLWLRYFQNLTEQNIYYY